MFDRPDSPPSSVPAGIEGRHRFAFDRDTLAFANELVWEYRFDSATGERRIGPSPRRPTYAHRCFVLARLVHLFTRHAEFQPDLPRLEPPLLEDRIRAVLGRNPRRIASPGERLRFPGWTGLRELSRQHEDLLKRLGGGAWRSYVLRSHWRMVFPISRRHQVITANSLAKGLTEDTSRVIHLVRFPQLTINHGVVVYEAAARPAGWQFLAYDPNDASQPVTVVFDALSRKFSLGPTRYWPGGWVDVIEIFRSWWL